MARGPGLGTILLGVGAAAAALWGLRKLLGTDAAKARDPVHAFIAGRVQRAAAVLGIAAPPVLESASVANAASDGRHILYNRSWVLGMLATHCRDGSCEDQVVLGIVAHELAHHHLRHASRKPHDPHGNELDADYYAGYVLAASGVGSQHLEAVLYSHSGMATPSHPGWLERVRAIRRGSAVAAGARFGWAT